MAYCVSFGTPSAQVVEIQMIDGKISVEKVYAVVDVGVALDPRNIEAQVQSGIKYGLSSAMLGEITVEEEKWLKVIFTIIFV